MTTQSSQQVLLDQLAQLRLPAFRQALEVQLAQPQYDELPFEERLALLVETEVLQRQENRVQRRVRQARFQQLEERFADRLGAGDRFLTRTRPAAATDLAIGGDHLDPQSPQPDHPQSHRRRQNLHRLCPGPGGLRTGPGRPIFSAPSVLSNAETCSTGRDVSQAGQVSPQC